MTTQATAMERAVGSRLVPHVVVSKSSDNISHKMVAYDVGAIGFRSISYSDDVFIDNVELDGAYLLHYTQAEGNLVFRNGSPYKLLPSQIQICVPGQKNQYFLPAGSRHISLRLSIGVLRDMCGIGLADMNWLKNHLIDSFHADKSFDLLEDIFIYGQDLVGTPHPTELQNRNAAKSLFIESALGMIFDRKARSCLNLPSQRFLSPPRHVFDAKKIIDGSLSEDISIAKIASDIGVSDRRLRSAFSQVFGKSPRHYLRSARLERLHHLICANEKEDTISNLMLDCGISSWGRYAHYFKNAYGYSPSDLQNMSEQLNAVSKTDYPGT